MKLAVTYAIRKAADWFFRKRSPALIAVRVGSALSLATLAGGWVVSFVYSDSDRSFELSYQSSGTAQFILLLGFIVGIAISAFGVVWEYQRHRNENKINSKRKTIVIEQRGLVDTSDSPLDEFLKLRCPWQVYSIVNDIRERLVDNVITRPDFALVKVNHLNITIAEMTAQSASSDISMAYGGVFPVPLTFYTGYLLDDESQITIFDWSRDEGQWRELEADDDGEQFILEQSELAEKSVVLAVSVSYPVDRQAIQSVFADMPVHYLSLLSLNRNNHWSKSKQDRLSGEFFEYCKILLGQGVEHIHLVLASQNSVAFRFGQAYDKRNLPSISVYQYERHQLVRYPWCLKIPHLAGEVPVIVNAEFKRAA
ncbi:SAVED domain-containing protein [Arsukibacterium perlucidum]|uniref:SAVED domain-containing protein n=1 Tax=Arsukibacterium perlucidum TaxID=368811 RepID=UPI00037A3435|nr:SAVED domain-containing protein [Arsukibacterium perlucidum]